jgi:shikimate dehydrogenase
VLNEPTRRAAVLGSPISHSLSPALHRAAYRGLGLSQWSYDVHDVQAEALGGFVAGLDASWAGLSLTMPLKEAAFEVAGEVSDLAREVGAINTLVRGRDGGWKGDNTDVYGVSQVLREAGREHVPSAVLLGSGATARSVVAALASLGCAKVTFAVRSGARPQTLAQARRAGLEVDVVGVGELAGVLDTSPLVVSTLPGNALGSGPSLNEQPGTGQSGNLPGSERAGSEQLGSVVPPGSRLPDHLFLDVVYAGWPTPLARSFREAGAVVVSGLELLVHQAVEQVYLMTGLRPTHAMADQMRAAGLAAMADND